MGRWVPVLIASILMLLVGPAASAWGDAKVRFVQTIPGCRAARAARDRGRDRPEDRAPVGFGEDRQLRGRARRQGRVRAAEPAGAARRDAASGSRTAPTTRSSPCSDRAPDRCSRTTAPRAAGRSLRVVQAAPELGQVDVRLGDEAVAEGVGFGDVAAYTAVAPGAYALQVTSPKDGSTIASRGAVTLTAGTSSTAFVIGTGGEPVETIVAADRAAAPRGAPATGLGGLADEDSAAAARPARGPPGRPRRRRDLRGADGPIAPRWLLEPPAPGAAGPRRP